MNKFGFLDRISAETCQKMDYFGSKSPKIGKYWVDPPPDSCTGYINTGCARPYTHIEITG